MTEKLINARKKSYHMEIDSLQKFVTGGQILDVGCGMGIFLDWFDDNWEKHGCDVSSYALKEAQKRGIKVYLGEFEELDFGNSQFDVVYFRASLHHAYSPQLCLKKAYELLKPNGIVAVCMSNNHDGLAGRLFKAHIKSYEQAHNYLFSKQTLRKYLETTGFKILKIGYPYFGTGYETRKDLMQLIPTYIKYLQLRLFKRLTKPGVYDFSSPAFYGNYINIFAKR
ncbi:class I SAM-dependent methyltransferase [bacterium]|nr:class I SAM-dependent methyltransferase [bacterium]